MNASLLGYRELLLRAVNLLEEELALYDPAGHLVHENPAMMRALAGQAGAEDLRSQMAEMARSVAAVACQETGLDPAKPESEVREVRAAQRRFRLRASYPGTLPDPMESVVLIVLQPLPPDLISIACLQKRYRLTDQEARVALLLAQQKTNAEIARELGISSHTARHHTEHILAKFGLHSRAEVARFLAQE